MTMVNPLALQNVQAHQNHASETLMSHFGKQNNMNYSRVPVFSNQSSIQAAQLKGPDRMNP